MAYDEALARPHAREMDFTGRPLTGRVYVDPPGIAGAAALGRWLELALAFVRSQPAKKSAPRKSAAKRNARAR